MSDEILADDANLDIAESVWGVAEWINEPGFYRVLPDHALQVVTDDQTDFWRETYYGFVRDSGHFLGFTVKGGFTAQVRVNADFYELYDQAGIMVRIDEKTWVKAGIEFNDGNPMISSVITRGQSDWAPGFFSGDSRDFWLRVTVAKGSLRLQYSTDGKSWPLLRLAPFPKADTYQVGPICCTPQRKGLQVRFSDWSLTEPLGRELHDLS
jgi:regulation of enolase protein 1 (concanavalin A-like superfamily)